MNFRRNKFCICMTNENLNITAFDVLTALEPKFKELTRTRKCHFSYQQSNK